MIRLRSISTASATPGVFSAVGQKRNETLPQPQLRDELIGNPHPQDFLIKRQRRALPDSSNRVLNTPPAEIPNLDIGTFRNITSAELESLSLEQVAQLTPKQTAAIPINILLSLSPEQISGLNPMIFRELPAQYFNQLLLVKRGLDYIGAITPEQIREIQVCSDLIRAFFIALKPAQTAALRGEQIAEIDPENFGDTSIIEIFSILNKAQFQALTANQIQTIDPKDFRQLISNLFHQDRNLFEELMPIQRRWLTQEQLSIVMALLEKNVLINYVIDRFQSLSKAEVQKLTQQEIQMLTPEMLQRSGIEFLRKLRVEQIDWLTDKQRRIFNVSDLNLIQQESLQTVASTQEKLRKVKQAYLAKLTPDEISKENPEFFSKLSESDILILSADQLKKMTSAQISYQKASFFRCLNINQLIALNTVQRQSIAPEVFAELTVESFWGKLLPLQPQLASIDPQHQRFLSPTQFHAVIQDLTPEQVSQIPVTVYQKMGDEFVLSIEWEAFSRIPALAFKYVTSQLIRRLNRIQAGGFSPTQIINLKLKAFSAFSDEQIVWINPAVFQVLNKNHVELLATNACSFSQIARLDPEVFASIPGTDLAKLNPRVFAALGVEHFNALAGLPAKQSIDGEITSHPIRWITGKQLQQIPREHIGNIHAAFFEKLTSEQFGAFREVQLRALPVEYIRMWKEENNLLYQKLVNKKNLLYSDQQIALEISPNGVPIDNNHSISSSSLKRARIERRAIVVFAPQFALETNEITDLQIATESFRTRYLNSDVYALGLDSNGRWREWRFVSAEDWATSWQTITNLPRGEYDKVILLGHGGDPNKIENHHFKILVDEFFRWAQDISEIKHLSLLVCGTRVDFGMMFLQGPEGPRLGNIPLLNGVQIERITGSELPVYIEKYDADGKPARRFYRDNTDGKIKHGVSEAKWEIKRNREGKMEVTGHLLSTSGDVEILSETGSYAGPFKYAEQRQAALKAEGEVRRYVEAKRALIKESEERAARLDNRSFSEHYIAVIDKLQKSAAGEYTLPVINIETGRQKTIKIPAEQATAYQAAQQNLKLAYQTLKTQIETQPDGVLKIKPVTEGMEARPGSMNAAFLIKALLETLKNKNRPLNLAEKLSLYTNLGGMGVAVAGDGLELAKLITQITAPGGTIERSLQNLTSIAEKTNTALILVNMGFDTYTLSTSKDPITRTAAGIDLGFNSAALGLQIAPRLIAAAIPEAAEASAGFGILAVPVMGLGIGFTALGIQIAEHNQEVHEFYKYLATYYKAEDEGAYTNKEGILVPAANIPISEINLRTGELTLNDIRIQASEPAAIHASNFAYSIQQASGAAPNHIYNKNRDPDYFNILKTNKQKLDTNAPALFLSAVPQTDIDYTYQHTATGKSTEEKQIDQRIQQMGKFEPSNSWGNLRAVVNPGNIRYRTSTQRILLDQKPRTIILPPKQTNPKFLEKTTFLIEGGGSTYQIRNLYTKTNLILTDQEKTTSTYHLETPEYDLLETGAVTHTNKTLTIQNQSQPLLTVDISGLQAGTTITLIGKNGQTHRTLVIGQQTPAQVLAGRAVITNLNIKDLPNFETLLKQKTNELADLVVINNGEQPYLQTLWDTKNRHLITPNPNYQNNPEPYLAYKIIGVTDQHTFFLNTQKQTLLQTDRLTNQPIATYQLRFDGDLTITTNGQQTYLTQTITQPEGAITLIHQLKKNCIELIDIRNLDNKRFRKFLNLSEALLTDLRRTQITDNNPDPAQQQRNLLEVLAAQLQLPAGNEPDNSILPAQIAEWTRIQGTNDKGKPQTLHLNLQNAYSIPMKLAWTNNILIAHGSYPPKTGGGGWLVLWNPDTKKTHFLTLDPSYFAPLSPSAPADRKKLRAINPFPAFHQLMADEKEVIPFPNPDGSVILVSSDGKRLSFVDIYGRETRTQYKADADDPDALEDDENKIDTIFASDAELVFETMVMSQTLGEKGNPPRQYSAHTMLAV